MGWVNLNSISSPLFCVCIFIYALSLSLIYLQENPGSLSVQLQLSSSSAGLGLQKPTAAELEVLLFTVDQKHLICKSLIACCKKCRGSLGRSRPEPIIVYYKY